MSTKTISVKIDPNSKEVTIGGIESDLNSISEAKPFLLGFFCAMVIPVIFLSALRIIGTEKLNLTAIISMGYEYYNPITVLLFFLTSVCAIVAFFSIHCFFHLGVAKLHRDCQKFQLDAATGLIHEAVKLELAKQKCGKEGEKLDVSLTIKGND